MHLLKPYNSQISKRIISVAYPIILGNASRALMGVVDMIMVGKLGVHSIAAVGFGEMLVFSLIAAIGISLMIATQTLTARRYGEKSYSKCGESLFNGQLLGVTLGLPFLIFGYLYCDNIIAFFLDDTLTINACVKYTSIQFLGILFPISGFIFRGFYTGIQKTGIYLKVVIISNIINVYLNLGLIFGSEKILEGLSNSTIPGLSFLGILWNIFPFPEMGIRGAALGTVAASLFSFLCFFFYFFSKDIRVIFSTDRFKINYMEMKKHLQLSWPVIKREGSLMIGIALFIAIMGLIGVIELAATNIIIRIYNIAIMPAFGIGSACASIVGYYLGMKNPDYSWLTVKDSLRYSMLIMGSLALCFIIFPEFILSAFTSDSELLKVAVPLLKFVGLIAFIDAIALVLMCTLDGAGDMKFISKIMLIYVWIIYLPLSYLMGIIFNFGLWGAWFSWLFGFLFLSFMLGLRVYQGNWKTISV